MADLELAHAAQDMDEEYKARLTEKAEKEFGLSSLKSMPQLKGFIEERTGVVIDSLDKNSIEDVIKTVESLKNVTDEDKQAVLDVIDLRREIGKTSNAKYTAILASAVVTEQASNTVASPSACKYRGVLGIRRFAYLPT